ncbi:uncharacterized protein J3D65DRAFT_378226 [Phyllosticta citribraziliensis]|uniref:Enoyl reductase (ER) domain-containing protein n=1 Tax=Phyllosticta citribraziliensis TaxID=989973 RepID=A0ABR1LQB6_9PEZI
MATTTPTTTPQIHAWTHTTGPYPECLTLTTLPAPHLPPPPPGEKGTHLLIRTTAAALNPVDIQLMNFPLFTPSLLPFPLSSLLTTWPTSALWSLNPLASRVKGVGADFAGEVVAAHAGSGFSVGDRVFGLVFAPGAQRGALSEALLLDAASDVVRRVPEGWSDVQAASLPLVALTARTCVERCVGHVDEGGEGDGNGDGHVKRSKKNTTLVVLGGASATGLYTTLLSAARGWRVVATCSPSKAALVRSMGAAETLDYTSFSSPAALRAAVAARRPAAIVDCVGGTALLALPGVRRYITIVGDKTSRSAVGGAATYAWNPRMALRALASSNASYLPQTLNAWIPAFARRWVGLGDEAYACVNLETRGDWLDECVGVVEAAEGGAKEKIVLDSVYAFEDARSAFERLDSGRCRGKVVVEIPGK